MPKAGEINFSIVVSFEFQLQKATAKTKIMPNVGNINFFMNILIRKQLKNKVLAFGNILVLVVPFSYSNFNGKEIQNLIFPAFGNILVLVLASSN